MSAIAFRMCLSNANRSLGSVRHSALFGLLCAVTFASSVCFIHCHPHLSILDLFLIRQMVPFSLPRFAKNIDSTYIGNYYFKNKIHKNKDKFDQLLVLGIGLDTKADVMEELEGKQVFGLDISADNISNIYEEADMTTKSIILNCDLTNLKKENVLKKLKDVGFSLEKKTYIIWEGGTYYIENSKVKDIISFWCESINVVGISLDFLNEDVFYNKSHPNRLVIEKVLEILKNSKEPWVGFFTPAKLKDYFSSLGFKEIEVVMHGDIESKLYDNPKVIEDLLFFITVF
ncbi:class I SAM-dependent methyltransferase [Paenibacillus larvae]|nr:class I SAM-dependent methyltransferase [Paenibacillus larvae]MDT2294636.1 class I SAM-dependent methyltransferase [Paenibacillus larvae]